MKKDMTQKGLGLRDLGKISLARTKGAVNLLQTKQAQFQEKLEQIFKKKGEKK